MPLLKGWLAKGCAADYTPWRGNSTVNCGLAQKSANFEPVTSVVYLTTRAPSKLADDLGLAGFRVFEALEVSEVLHLCEHEKIDAVVIGADVQDPDLIEVQLRHITMKLRPEATLQELVWELTQLFPDKSVSIQ